MGPKVPIPDLWLPLWGPSRWTASGFMSNYTVPAGKPKTASKNKNSTCFADPTSWLGHKSQSTAALVLLGPSSITTGRPITPKRLFGQKPVHYSQHSTRHTNNSGRYLKISFLRKIFMKNCGKRFNFWHLGEMQANQELTVAVISGSSLLDWTWARDINSIFVFRYMLLHLQNPEYGCKPQKWCELSAFTIIALYPSHKQNVCGMSVHQPLWQSRI